MNALFADTFYWIALADFTGSAHHRALTLTPSSITTANISKILADCKSKAFYNRGATSTECWERRRTGSSTSGRLVGTLRHF